MKVSKNSQKNNLETVTNENDKEMPKEMPKERYMSPEEKQKIIDNLRSVYNSIIMEYQKIINLLNKTPNQPTKFRTKNWVEINNDSRGTYNTNSQIKL